MRLPHRRWQLVALAAAVFAVSLAGVAAGSEVFSDSAPPPHPTDDPAHLVRQFSDAPPPQHPDPATVAKLRESALQAAAQSGGTPTSAVIFRTTRQRAQEGIGAGIVNSDQPVYLIVIRGDFRAEEHAPDGRIVTIEGDVVTLTIDPKTFNVTDGSLQKAEVDTARLGSPIRLGL